MAKYCQSQEKLLYALLDKEYSFQTFDEFIEDQKKKAVILRHDVDKLPLFGLMILGLSNDD